MLDVIRYGDRALLVNFEQQIDVGIHQKVIQLQNELDKLQGVEYTIPAYCSLTIGFNPELIEELELKFFIKNQGEKSHKSIKHRHLKIPVCYNEQFGWDINELCHQNKLSKDELIKLHANTEYHVYMMGFIPGFAYMGKTHKKLYCPRKKEPRKRIDRNSVAIAGAQTGIYPLDAPGGWQVIGKSPINVVESIKEDPFVFQISDKVEFYPITVERYFEIKTAYENGNYEIEVTYA